MCISVESIKKIFPIILLAVCCYPLYAQDDNIWNHKKCAVVLTYDDALNTDIDHVAPLLDSLGLKSDVLCLRKFSRISSTTYRLENARATWARIRQSFAFSSVRRRQTGTEIGDGIYNLNHYTRSRLIDEITLNNVILNMLDGKKERTFAYPCGDTKFGDSSYVPDIKKKFVAARGVEGKHSASMK